MSETARLTGFILLAVIGGGGTGVIIALYMRYIPGAREAIEELNDAVEECKAAFADSLWPVVMPVIDWLERRLNA